MAKVKYNGDDTHYWAPQRKLGGGWIVFGSDPTPPPVPDPVQTANAQTKSNIETAGANAALNRTNQYTPWGSLEYTKTPGAITFDQAGYDAALEKYNNSVNSGLRREMYDAEGNVTGSYYDSKNYSGVAPDKKDFTKQGVDNWSSTVKLDPSQQKLLDANNGFSQYLAELGQNQLGSVSNSMGQPLNFNGLPSMQSNVGYGNTPTQSNASYGSIQNQIDMSNVPKLIGGDDLVRDLSTQRDSMYNQHKAFLDPQWQQDQRDLENKLVQQGVMQNSDAWNRATGDFGRNKEFAYNNARNAAITGGGAEQSRLFGLGLASNQNAYGQALNNGQFANSAQAQGFGQSMANAQLANQVNQQNFGQGLANANLANSARGQGINELMLQRQNPLNELNALRTGSQVTSPQFGNVPQVGLQGTDIAGLTNQNYNNRMGQYNAQMAQSNGLTSGLFGLGAAGIGAAGNAGGFGALLAGI